MPVEIDLSKFKLRPDREIRVYDAQPGVVGLGPDCRVWVKTVGGAIIIDDNNEPRTCENESLRDVGYVFTPDPNIVVRITVERK